MVSSKCPCFATNLQSRSKITRFYVEFSVNFSEILIEPYFNSSILSGRGYMEDRYGLLNELPRNNQ